VISRSDPASFPVAAGPLPQSAYYLAGHRVKPCRCARTRLKDPPDLSRSTVGPEQAEPSPFRSGRRWPQSLGAPVRPCYCASCGSAAVVEPDARGLLRPGQTGNAWLTAWRTFTGRGRSRSSRGRSRANRPCGDRYTAARRLTCPSTPASVTRLSRSRTDSFSIVGSRSGRLGLIS
jgi:hypothetical protein